MAKGQSRNAEKYLDEQDEYIEREYGVGYEELDRQQQKEVILDVFFDGLVKYNHSAEMLRNGIARTKGEREQPEKYQRTYYREKGRTAKEKPHYQRVQRRGRGYMFKRNRYGRFTR